MGWGDRRKGLDLFLDVAAQVGRESNDRITFLWVGDPEARWEREIRDRARRLGNLILQGTDPDLSVYYAGSDVFLLTSREDPFPSVVLEAMNVGLPVIGFAGAGGFSDIVDDTTGCLVPFEDTEAMGRQVLELLGDESRRTQMGEAARNLIESRFNFSLYVYRLLGLLGEEFRRVSVIVPNYNYARHLPLRLQSILEQTYPVFEVIFLDDASSDGSIEVATQFLSAADNHRIISNQENSGSVFRQWRKGLGLASGDLIWIAEADDYCDPRFLERTVGCFERDESVVLAYSQSSQVDESGRTTEADYLAYTQDVSEERWRGDYVRDGVDEIRDSLAVKNTIPNVSAVVFKNKGLGDIADAIAGFRIAGDWRFYVWLLQQGKVAFVAEPLNCHRRHDRGVTLAGDKDRHIQEVVSLQDYIEEEFGVTEETRTKALEYREHVRSFLGIGDGESSYEAGDPQASSSGMERVAASSDHEARSPDADRERDRLIAFYLPQYHPIPENNRWWGNGFTEWTNVTQARPLFRGHFQPRLPTELGFYDLRLADARMAQAELARAFGIHGFCYYHYWFMGRRLLERPFKEVLASGKPDFPFCLCWANETWSRRWLGEEHSVLIKQEYSPEDDLAHARELLSAFADERYIKVAGRPLFIVYRPLDLPEPARTVEVFRQVCSKEGLPEPFLVGANGHSFHQDSRLLGFDHTLDFRPQLGALPRAFEERPSMGALYRNMRLGIISRRLKVYRYEEGIARMEARAPRHPVIPSVFAGWDNTPRRGDKAIVMLGCTPDRFERYLDAAVERAVALDNGGKLVFVNAWNEWAEGNCLEPNQRYGLGYLAAIRKVLGGSDKVWRS